MFTGGYFRYGIHCWVSQQPQINWAPTISLCLAGRPIYQGFMALFWDVLSGKFLCASFFAKLEISEDLFFPPHFPSSSHIFPTFSPGFPQVSLTFCGSAGWHATRMPWPWAPATSAASMMRRPSSQDVSFWGVSWCWSNYPLVNIQITMENQWKSPIFNGKTHYFNGHSNFCITHRIHGAGI